MIDQAGKLRRMVEDHNKTGEEREKHQIKIYSVVSGKGGVGKTNLTINLAIKFQQMGKKVLILDADIGMSNVNIMFGVETHLTLFNLLRDNATLTDIIVKCPEGVDLISGGADLLNLEDLNYTKQQQIIELLSELGAYDILLIDNGAGISKHSLTFSIFAHELILITTPEPTAITDAYRVLKAISTYKVKDKVKVIINEINELSYGEQTFSKLLKTSEQFLDLNLEKLGFIFNDIRVSKAIMEQKPVVLRYPDSLASKNISQISKNILEDKNYSCDISNFKQLTNRIIKIFG
ncbi:MinD/ParA family protein [Alkalibaculum sporogenes]|nr:MinD/ParA family protein [Alkalibaculum sporogenes]